jgi:hypothetical protein
MKKLTLLSAAFLLIASSVMADGTTPAKKAKNLKPKTDKCVKGSKECKKKGC